VKGKQNREWGEEGYKVLSGGDWVKSSTSLIRSFHLLSSEGLLRPSGSSSLTVTHLASDVTPTSIENFILSDPLNLNDKLVRFFPFPCNSLAA
jgi:hypothetical protein